MNRHHIVLSTLQMGSLIVSLGAQVLMAQRIGPGLQLDSYFAAIGLAMAFVGSVAVGGTYLLPARIRTDGKTPGEQSDIAGNGVVAIITVAIVVAIITFVVSLASAVSGQEVNPVAHDRQLIGLSWFAAFTSVLAAAWGAVGNAHGQVVGTLTLGMVPPASMTAYLLVVVSPSVVGIAGSQLAGISVQALGLAWIYRKFWSLRRLDYHIIGRIASNVPLAVTGALCFSAYSAVDAWFAPGLGGGTLSHQALAQRLVIAFSAILSAGPFFLSPSITATMLNDGRRPDAWKYICKAGITMTLICLVASASTLWLGRWAISIFFERGAFGPSDTQAVSTVVTILLIGAGPMLASAVAFRVLHNTGNSNYVAVLSIAWIVVYTFFVKFLAIWFFSFALAMAYVVAWSTITLATFFLLARTLKANA